MHGERIGQTQAVVSTIKHIVRAGACWMREAVYSVIYRYNIYMIYRYNIYMKDYITCAKL